ncbi:MAG: chloride channel protein [Pseudomonadota bacterium]
MRSAPRRIVVRDNLVLLGLAVAIGIASGIASIGFRYLLGLTQFLFYGDASEKLASRASQLDWWQILLATTFGGLLIGLLLKHLLGGKRAEGVAHVIEACALRGGRMNLDTAIRSAIVNACSLGVGASTGREGPVVHLGAALASRTAHYFGMPTKVSRSLLGCGVAAAVAASFNAPIAGVFFALEVVIGHYALSAFAPVVVASVAGTLVSRGYYGDYPAFVLPDYFIGSVFEFPAFLMLGIVCAVVSIIFLLSIRAAELVFDWIDPPIILRPVMAGFSVGVIAIAFPHVLGVGYEGTDLAANGQMSLTLLFALIIFKNIASSISLAGGFGGGVFSPSLFLGAMTGGVFGIVATGLFPDQSSADGVYALAGMGAVAGAMLGAPISTILIIFEMTGDYELTIAVMIAVVACVTLHMQVIGDSFFSWQLSMRGINLESGREVGLLSEIRVRDVMKPNYAHIQSAETVADVAERLKTAHHGSLFVLDEQGKFAGTVGVPDLMLALDRQETAEGEPKQSEIATAGDMVRKDPPFLSGTDTLDVAMRLIEETGESHVAVLDNIISRRLVGILHEHDVMVAYHRALLEAQA